MNTNIPCPKPTEAMIAAAGAVLQDEFDLSRGIAASVAEDMLRAAFRAKSDGELIPGVVVKDSVVHRRWSDPEVAAQLAQETIGACLRLLVKLLPHIGNYELYDRTKWMINRIERELRNG